MARRRLAGVLCAWLSILLLLTTASPIHAGSLEAIPKGDYETMNAMDLTLAMQPGWNMGNTLDATGGETSWGNPEVTRELLAAIKAEGFNSIRIPVTWAHSVGGSPEYKITDAYMERVHEVVDWALELDFIVMINMHHDSNWLHDLPSRTDLLIDRFAKIWEQIADSFKDYPHSLIFEAINEPRFSDDWGLETEAHFDLVDQLNNRAYEIIRASGSKNSDRKIVMETLVAGITQTKLDKLKANILSHNDPNLIASVHYYGLYPFSVNIAGKTSFDDETRLDIDHQMQIIHDTLVADGIPVILGEYGLLGFDDSTGVIQQGEKLKFFDYLVSKANSLDITTVLWDNGQHYERNEHYWRDPALHAVIMQAVKGRSSSTEHDSLYIPVTAIEDQALQLNLNGNRLVSITDSSGREWSEDSDYSLEGETLVLKAAAIEELTSAVVGRDHSLKLHFSDGPDWEQHLFIIDEASLAAAEHSTHGFSIPADLQADKVRAIKAVGQGGKNLSSNAWTPYLSFSSEYTVDYDAESIDISATVLSQIQSGYVYLTVEMWSGLELPYSITVQDGRMIGVPSAEPLELEAGPEETSSETEPLATETETVPDETEGKLTDPSENTEPSQTEAVTDEGAEEKSRRPLLIAAIAAATVAVAGIVGKILRKKKKNKN